MKNTIAVMVGNNDQVDRLTQWGVKFPDGSIVWSDYDGAYTPKVSFDGSDYQLLPLYDDRRNINTFSELVNQHRKKLARLGVEPIDPVRVTREIVVVYSKPTATEWTEPVK